jgi:hypothetical protein
MTGKDLAEEDEAFMKYLAANGWVGEVGEDDGEHVLRKEDSSEDVEKTTKQVEAGAV